MPKGSTARSRQCAACSQAEAAAVPETQHLLVFIAAGWLLNLTPGPDVLYNVTHSLRSGARAGIVAGLGITAGCCVHVAAAAIGVGALLATSALAFTLLKWIGAAYLLWMGAKILLSRAAPAADLQQLARSGTDKTLRQV